MTKKRKLSRRQLAVMEDIFGGELTEQEILDKHKVSRNLFSRWLADETFSEQFDLHIAAAYRQSAALVARYATLAATRLIELTESEKTETARKACLDIISVPLSADVKPDQLPARPQDDINPTTPLLSEQTAGKLLAVLAEEKSSG